MARYPNATWRPCAKQGYGSDNVHLNLGAVVHSMDGSLSAGFGVLDNAARQASWHFSVALNGQVWQHIDSANIAWTSGSYQANKRYWGIECEGSGAPLTDAQHTAVAAILRWLWATHGTQGGFTRRVTLWEHNEMIIYGSLPTACPSGRVIWITIIARAQAGSGGFLMALTDEEQAEALQRLRNLDSENDTELALAQQILDILTQQVPDKWNAGTFRWVDALYQLYAIFLDKVPDGRGGMKPRVQAILDGALASIPMLVKSPSTHYIYEVVDGKVIHGSNPVVAAATWGPNWNAYLVALDKNNPDHAEILRMEAEYPDGVPTELGGL